MLVDSPYFTSNLALPFETNVVINGTSYPQPHWCLTTSNDLQVVTMDTAVSPYRVIDYVQLSGPNSVRDLTSEIISNYDTQPGPSGNDLWSTNTQNGVPSGPIGIVSQIGVSLGVYTPGAASGSWSATTQTELENEIDAFRAFDRRHGCHRCRSHGTGAGLASGKPPGVSDEYQ